MTQRAQKASQAFSVVELLVVVGIMAILLGMVLALGVLRKDKEGLRVEEAARGVERMLYEARNLALTLGQPHAVVFNIENSGSGLVIRNGSKSDTKDHQGRHWCCIIGPYPAILWRPSTGGSTAESLKYQDLPRMGYYFPTIQPSEYGSSQRLAATVEKCQVGGRFYLPRGSRFLALGDAEDNLHDPTALDIPFKKRDFQINDWTIGTNARTGNVNLSGTYPRPWFGYVEGSGNAWRLHAWGGYDSEGKFGATPIFGSGLDFECTNYGGTLNRVYQNGKTNNASCTCYLNSANPAKTPALNTLGEPMRPCGDINKARPLINGYWMDYMIVFLPNGQARAMTFYNRNALYNLSTNTNGALPDVITGGYNGNSTFRGRDDGIIVHESNVTGGPTITVARDPEDDTAVFSNVHEAWKSILPVRRVTVNEITGGVKVMKPYSTIQQWLDDQERGIPAAQRIWSNGWLPVTNPLTDPDQNKIRVNGPFVESMMLQRDPYPWIKPRP